MSSHNSNVLYLSYDGLTDPLGQSQILPYLSGLATKGYSISVISFEKPDRSKAVGKYTQERCEESGIRWVPLVYHKNPPVLSTLYDLRLLMKTAKKMHRQQNFSIVHCRSYITALVGLELRRKCGVKFIFDMRGFWADERIEGGLWNMQNPLYAQLYKFFKRKEAEFIKTADHVIVLTDAARNEILSWKFNTKISVIPCCVDVEIFNPLLYGAEQTKEVRSTLGLKEHDFVLLYLGSLGTWYLYDEMMTFFRKLKSAVPNARFLLLTPDVDKVGSDPDVIVSTVTRDKIPQYIAASDASICFIRPSFSKKGSSATKMAEVLSMGIPVLSNAGWGDVEFLQNHVQGLYLIPDVTDFPEKSFYNGAIVKRQSEFFYEFFSLQNGVTKYDRIYQMLIAH